MTVVELHEPLKLERDPFAAVVAGVHIGHPLRTAFSEIIQHIGRRTPVILVTGNASTGKTLLVDMIVRAGAEKRLCVKRVDRGDLLPMALGKACDVLLVDEANSVADSLLETFAQARSKTAATTVFLGFPSCLGRVAFSKLRPVHIELAAFPASDGRSYLLALAKKAGLPDLFTSEALDLIVDGAQGSPRLLRSIASLAYFGAVSDRAPQISLKYATSALVGQVPSAAPKLDKGAPGVVRAHEVPVRQRRSTEIPSYIRRASEGIEGLVRQGVAGAEPRKSIEPRGSENLTPQETKPAPAGKAVETPANTQTISGRTETSDRTKPPAVVIEPHQAAENIEERVREETVAQQQSLTRENAISAERQSTIEILPTLQQTSKSTEDLVDEEAADPRNTLELAADRHAQAAGIEGIVSDEDLSPPDEIPVEAHTAPEANEVTEEFANDAWALAADEDTLPIADDSEAIAEAIRRPEDTQASADLSARSLSDAESFGERLFVSTHQERSAQDPTDADQTQMAYFSSKPVASRRAIPSNLKYLVIVAVCILVGAVAVIAAVAPSMLSGTSSDVATLPINAPVPQAATGIAAPPPALLPDPALSPAQSVPPQAVPAQRDIALAAKETPPADVQAKSVSADSAVSDTKRSARRPLTDEEKAAVARGIQELERAARQGPPRR